MSAEELTAYIEKKVNEKVRGMKINPGTMPKQYRMSVEATKAEREKRLKREEEMRGLNIANREYREALSTRSRTKTRIKEIESALARMRSETFPDWGTIVALGDEMTNLQYKLESAEQRIRVLGEDYKVVNRGGAISLALR